MRFLFFLSLFLVVSSSLFAQDELSKTLKQLNTESVPYVKVDEITSTKDIMILDTRKREEFAVSHIKNAIWVGHKAFEQESLVKKIPSKDTPIVVYCSIGVRSEDIGEKLQKAGYTNVKNLYGGIFEWKNQGNAVFNTKHIETDSVHTFNKEWGKLLEKGIKVY